MIRNCAVVHHIFSRDSLFFRVSQLLSSEETEYNWMAHPSRMYPLASSDNQTWQWHFHRWVSIHRWPIGDFSRHFWWHGRLWEITTFWLRLLAPAALNRSKVPALLPLYLHFWASAGGVLGGHSGNLSVLEWSSQHITTFQSTWV